MKTHFHLKKTFGGQGFTFLEIILVVAIIGILDGIVGPRLVGQAKKAKITATRMEINGIKISLGRYEMDHDRFPTSSEGLRALVVRPSSVREDVWDKYMDSLPKDDWSEEYIYKYPSEHDMDFDLSSKGPDRIEGTEDDITNWDESGDKG